LPAEQALCVATMAVLGQPRSSGWGDPGVPPSGLIETLREIAANASRCNSYTFGDEAEALARALEPVLPVLEVAAALLAPKVPPAIRVVPVKKGLWVWTLTAAAEPTLVKAKPRRRDQLAAAWDCLFAPLRSPLPAYRNPPPSRSPARPVLTRPPRQVSVAAVPVRRRRRRGGRARGAGAV
jgi:hypothetical protein